MPKYSDTSDIISGLEMYQQQENVGVSDTSVSITPSIPIVSDTVTTDTATQTASVPSRGSVKEEIVYSHIPFITNIYPYDYDYPLSTYKIKRRQYKDPYYSKVYNKYHSNLFVYDEDLDDLTEDTLNYTVSEKPKKKKGSKKKGSKKKGSKKKGSKKKGSKKKGKKKR